jgi:alpha-amylase
MSSFDFLKEFDGPPMEENGKIKSPQFSENGTCLDGWICEHRWPIILAMVRFRFVVGNSPITNYADNGQNQIAFCRGNLGFIAINNELSLNMRSNLKACVPPGIYCDIITGGKIGEECAGEEIMVDDNGRVEVSIPWEKEVPIVAIHAESVRFLN